MADRYFYHLSKGRRPAVIGSGDYCVIFNHEALGVFRNAVEEFMRLTGCLEEEIILALGNHDDPARLNTWIWNQVWGQRRPPEEVERRGT